uniref:Uncharacterized protein n=1 Tax=Oryza punctata TaxID=4537 RepID=A0A0E0KHZ0_ORYPU
MGDATTKEKKKVIVTAYEEVPPPPRRRPPGSGRAGSTSSSTTMTTAEVTTWRQAKAAPASASAAHHGVAGARYRGSNRRALLLAYAQHLRRRDQRGAGGGRPRVLLEWGKWKAQGHPGVGAGGNAVREDIDWQIAVCLFDSFHVSLTCARACHVGCSVVAGGEEEKLVLQVPAVDQGVSPASSENRGECAVQEQGDQSTGQCRIIWLIDRLPLLPICCAAPFWRI